MDFLYDDIRNQNFGLHSETRQVAGQTIYVLQLVNMQSGQPEREKTFHEWQDYSASYSQMFQMLQSAPQ